MRGRLQLISGVSLGHGGHRLRGLSRGCFAFTGGWHEGRGWDSRNVINLPSLGADLPDGPPAAPRGGLSAGGGAAVPTRPGMCPEPHPNSQEQLCAAVAPTPCLLPRSAAPRALSHVSAHSGHSRSGAVAPSPGQTQCRADPSVCRDLTGVPLGREWRLTVCLCVCVCRRGGAVPVDSDQMNPNQTKQNRVT